jgi:hypothetical protein
MTYDNARFSCIVITSQFLIDFLFNCFDQIMDEVTHQSSNTAFNSFKCNTITDYAKLFLLSRCLIHSEICNSLVTFGMKQFGYYPFQD